jgi:hypothetical protein
MQATIATAPDDQALARKLVAEGWVGVSNKYCLVIRWKTPPPTPDRIIAKEFQDTFWGKTMMALYKQRILGDWELRQAPKELVEEMTLTFAQYRAFKNLINSGWRKLLGKAS